ncbi:MAG: hypothetical protein O3A53_08520 [Acidobacteria bacterium]|nr:hypothetical protein [Acidobacteriota bacterium]
MVEEFQIDGPAWRPTSWTRLHIPILPTGQTVPFNASFPAQARFLDWGWSSLEPWGVWSDGPSAALSFSSVSASQKPIDLVVDAWIYVRPETPLLALSLTANDQPIGTWEIEYPQTTVTLRAQIMPEMWRGGDRMTLEFDMDRAIPLESLPTPPPRMLGVGLLSVRLEPAPMKID